MSLILTPEPHERRRGGRTLLDRVVALVPIEVVSTYAAIAAAAPSARQLWIAVVVGVAATVATLSAYGRHVRRRAGPAQHVVRTLAFVAWTFVLSNPLAPAAPVARWLPGLAVVLIPLVGAFMFPPASPIEPIRRD
ncbi:MAG: hypothetical protein JNK64_05735 [Myxococcales bacterium]|nr:hypothetical protein [Myxococcales bacterium]